MIFLGRVRIHGEAGRIEASMEWLSRWMATVDQWLVIDRMSAALQYCSMTAIPVSKRGTVTLPPEVRRKLGLESVPNPMLLVELRDGGVFLHPAAAVPVRDIPLQQMQKWIKDDEKGAEKFWKKEKARR